MIVSKDIISGLRIDDMYGIISQEPVENFIKSDNKDTYIEKVGFFMLKKASQENDLVEIFLEVFLWYSFFSERPLYMGLFSKHEVFNNFANIVEICKFGKVPICSHEAGKNFEKVLDVTDRMPVNNEYMNTVMNKVIKNDFAKHTAIQVLLDGMNTDFEIINT